MRRGAKEGTPATDVAGHYDREDPLFRALWGDHLHHGVSPGWRHEARALASLERMVSLLGLHPGERLLDIGCGYGGPALHLTRRHGLRVVGITLSAAQAHRAGRLAAAEPDGAAPRFLRADWLHSPFAPSSFDVALSVECYEHVADKPAYWSELSRVLVPGGRAVVAAWCAGENPNDRQQGRLLDPIRRSARLACLQTEEEIVASVEAAGFEVSALEDWSREVIGTWPRAVLKTGVALVLRREVRARALGSDGQGRTDPWTPLRMVRALGTGALRYLVLRVERTPSSAG